MRLALLLPVLAAACGVPEGEILLRPEPMTCRREPVSAVRVLLQGDFPETVATATLGPEAAPLRLLVPQGEVVRSVGVEGLSPRQVVALGWSGPIPETPAGGQRVVPVVYGAPDSLCQVASLRTPRAYHRATLVGDGQVLVTGGLSPEGPTDTLERHSTTSGEIFRALPTYEGAAIGHSATALPDGKLLLAGGARPEPGRADAARSRARVYRVDGEPQGGVLLLEGGARALHGAVALPDGQVFLSGGCSRVEALAPGGVPSCAAGQVLDTSVRYDREGNFVIGPLLAQPRYGHETHALPDGRVLLSGGYTVAAGKVVPALQAEVLDPLAPARTRAGVLAGRSGGGSALLPGGGLLWADSGGGDGQAGGLLLPQEGALPGPPAPVSARRDALLVALPDGAALLSGGRDGAGALAPALELYEAGRYRVLDDALPVIGHAAVPLPDGTLLLTGGLVGKGLVPSTQVMRFIHSLRVPDATPPAWPMAPSEGPRWVAARRPDRVQFDGTTLLLSSDGAGAAGRPGELALLAGPRLLGGELTVEAAMRASGPKPVGLALVLGHKGDGDYHFVRLQPGLDVALLRVERAAVTEVGGCQRRPLPPDALRQPAAVRLRLSASGLSVWVGEEEHLRCQVAVGRGGIGLGSLGGVAQFRELKLQRGR
jgi:hypothetical protein